MIFKLMIVKIFDEAFAHEKFCGSKIGKNESKYICWDRSRIINENDIVFFTDSMLSMVDYVNVRCTKIAWLIEPPCINYLPYNYIKKNNTKFDFVVSHQDDLGISNVKILPQWCSWIKPEKQEVSKKSKLLSIIASNKRSSVGHRLRHDIIDHIENRINLDKFGGLTTGGIGYNSIEDKSDGLSPYMFSIIIENEKSNYYFTEKIIDCMITGTVPIYWGANRIGEFFNTDGMFIIDGLSDMDRILPDIVGEKYDSLFPYIKENFERASKYLTIEDYFYENFLKEYVN